MEPFVKKGFTLEISEWAKVNGLKAGFTLRNGDLNVGLHVGDEYEKVISNREKIASNVGISLDSWVCTEQTHRDNILKVEAKHKGMGSRDYSTAVRDTDGLYTTESGIILMQFFADCTPVFFLHEQTKTIAVVHAGWKGTVLGIAGKMIDTLNIVEEINPSEVKVAIGPAICADCYEVDGEIVVKAREAFGSDNGKILFTDEDSKMHFDTQLANEHFLLEAGVRRENILKTKYCTCCDSDMFFSHRGENGKTGRMMAFIGWNEA